MYTPRAFEIVDAETIRSFTERNGFGTLIATYESDRPAAWKLDTNDDQLISLLDAIKCFRIRVDAIQAKFKLNQNKSDENQRNVIDQLRRRGGDMNLEIADLMEARTSFPMYPLLL